MAGENYRSCLNRAYYAAYSKVTSALPARRALHSPRAAKDQVIPANWGLAGCDA